MGQDTVQGPLFLLIFYTKPRTIEDSVDIFSESVTELQDSDTVTMNHPLKVSGNLSSLSGLNLMSKMDYYRHTEIRSIKRIQIQKVDNFTPNIVGWFPDITPNLYRTHSEWTTYSPWDNSHSSVGVTKEVTGNRSETTQLRRRRAPILKVVGGSETTTKDLLFYRTSVKRVSYQDTVINFTDENSLPILRFKVNFNFEESLFGWQKKIFCKDFINLFKLVIDLSSTLIP